MIDYEGMVREFHEKFDHVIAEELDAGTIELAILRSSLVKEEGDELIEAIKVGNIVSMADGLADLLYVTFGTVISFGIPIDKVFKEVHRSNMSKINDKTLLGKTKKGPNFSPPNIKEILYDA